MGTLRNTLPEYLMYMILLSLLLHPETEGSGTISCAKYLMLGVQVF